MAYQLKITATFKRNAKQCKKKGFPMDELWDTVRILIEQGALPDSYSPHMLHDEYEGCMECHILPDWLLVWRQDERRKIVCLTNIGTHADLFG